MQNQSEVARLLESIRLSYEAAYLALHGPAIVGRHEIITKRMENMQEAHEELKTIVGEMEINDEYMQAFLLIGWEKYSLEPKTQA